MIYAISAVDEDFGIGFNNSLLEKIPEDLKFFKQQTEGKIVVMGRKTYESMGNKPLPNRTNIVLTSNVEKYEGINEDTLFFTFEDFEIFLSKFKDKYDIFIIGGQKIYEKYLKNCDIVYLTKIFKVHDSIDRYFPKELLLNCFELKERDEIRYSEKGKAYFQFQTYSNKL